MLLGRAPLRISFSGGGTDLEEYHSRFGGYAISYTINKYTFVIAKLRQDNKLQGFSPDFASYLPPAKRRNTKRKKSIIHIQIHYNYVLIILMVMYLFQR